MAIDDEKRSGRTIALGLLLFLATCIAYLPLRGADFVSYDDDVYVTENPHLAQGWSAAALRWALTNTDYGDNWHPLTWASHLLDVELFGLSPGPPHGENVLLHALAAVLAFGAFRALTGREMASFVAAALFAWHPLRVESVAWISQRKDVLAGVFWMLSLWTYACYARRPGLGRYAALLFAFLLALASKPTAITLPLVLLALDVWPLGRTGAEGARARLVREKLPLIALSGAVALLTWIAQREGGALNTWSVIGPLARIENACIAAVQYLGKLFWPVDLAVLYPHPALVDPETSRLVPALACAALLGGLTWAALRARSCCSMLFTGWVAYAVALLPMIGLVQVGHQAYADRYTYLPLIGIHWILAYGGACWVASRPRWSRLVTTTTIVALGACLVLTWRQVRVWQSSEALFGQALAATERNYVAHLNLGQVQAEAGRLEEALAHFEAVIAIRPVEPDAHENLGKAHYLREDFAAATSAFEEAVRLRPANAESHFNLGMARGRSGDRAAGIEALERALELDPTHAKARAALQQLGRSGGRKP